MCVRVCVNVHNIPIISSHTEHRYQSVGHWLPDDELPIYSSWLGTKRSLNNSHLITAYCVFPKRNSRDSCCVFDSNCPSTLNQHDAVTSYVNWQINLSSIDKNTQSAYIERYRVII